jgi:hypothetical protein
MPATGQEKSDVERTVFALQRRFATPVPSVRNMDELNHHLLACCLDERQRTVSGRSQSIGAMFELEKLHAVELPPRPFDSCIQSIRQADKYQTVLFEQVRYSVPRPVAFEPVTVKAYLEAVVLIHKGQVVARHRRSRTPGEQILDPLHFMAVLSRKPAYLDQTKLFKELKLPAAFGRLRERLVEELGERTGTRHYIRVLQLLGQHSARRVAEVIETCLNRVGTPRIRAEWITQKLNSSSSPTPDTSATEMNRTLAVVQVPMPDLRRFDQLLNPSYLKGDRDERPEQPAAQAQSQDIEAADNAGRIRQALA